jgi:hypothetical protein
MHTPIKNIYKQYHRIYLKDFASQLDARSYKRSLQKYNLIQKEAIYMGSHAHQRYQVHNTNQRLPCECSMHEDTME